MLKKTTFVLGITLALGTVSSFGLISSIDTPATTSANGFVQDRIAALGFDGLSSNYKGIARIGSALAIRK